MAIPAVAGLIALRDRGAAWLVVPALWPYTQLHYAAIALPALRGAPILALLLCFPFPLLPPVAVILEACRVQLLSLRAKRHLAESSQRRGVAAEAD